MAQQPARGTFQYRVDGTYEGEAMEPWSATTEVRDTLGTFTVRHVVHRGPGTRFEYSYVPGKEAVWINEGRMGSSSCRATLSDEVPDFALPYAVASMTASHVAFTMLKCNQRQVERVDVTGDVVANADGWTVKGGRDYPFELTLGKDRRVLKFVQPQGLVGYAIYTLQ